MFVPEWKKKERRWKRENDEKKIWEEMERLEIKKVYIRNIENKQWQWKKEKEKNREQQKLVTIYFIL